MNKSNRRKWLAPEMVLASVTDSGPAVICSLLRGYGLPASLGRIRAACRREFDGSDISQLGQLLEGQGMKVSRLTAPCEVLTAGLAPLPLLMEVSAHDQDHRFVLIWRRVGKRYQIMDSAKGRYWCDAQQLERMLGRDSEPVDAKAWRSEAAGDMTRTCLHIGLSRLGLADQDCRELIEKAFAVTDWTGPAGLDAAVRLTADLVTAGGLRSKREILNALTAFVEVAHLQPQRDFRDIPLKWWRVTPDPNGEGLIRWGKRMLAVSLDPDGVVNDPEPKSAQSGPSQTKPLQYLINMTLSEAGAVMPLYLITLVWHVLMGVIEALIFRGFLDIGAHLALDQRLGAVSMLVLFQVLVLAQTFMIGSWRLAVGNRMEARIRVAYMEKIPRLGEANLGSMTFGDLAERGHGIRASRNFLRVFSHALIHTMEILMCVVCLIWLDPAIAPHAVIAALIVLLAPIVVRPLLEESERRLHTHGGRLSHLFLDALKGLTAFRVHGAERALNRTYEAVLTRWVDASRRYESSSAMLQGLLSMLGYALAAWLTLVHLSHQPKPGTLLLFLYWSLRMPSQTEYVIAAIKNLLPIRNRAARLLEVLELPESGEFSPEPAPKSTQTNGFAIQLEGMGMKLSGNEILAELSLNIQPGEHIAVVGPSGSGKSTLTQILLGAQRPTSGQLLFDGVPVTESDPRLGNRAWVSPAVKLWNRTLLENLIYGTNADDDHRLGEVIESAMLAEVISQLPNGLQTNLGEGGSFLSGGQAQRVRLGRAMLQRHARLVLLDEAFRGLDMNMRHELMLRVKAWWPKATLLFITHDVHESLFFKRVLVIEKGRLVEDGNPAALKARPDSKLSGLLEAHERVEREVWQNPTWRSLYLEQGTFRAES